MNLLAKTSTSAVRVSALALAFAFCLQANAYGHQNGHTDGPHKPGRPTVPVPATVSDLRPSGPNPGREIFNPKPGRIPKTDLAGVYSGNELTLQELLKALRDLKEKEKNQQQRRLRFSEVESTAAR